MKKDIVILGAGGLAREVAWTIEDINKAGCEWNILGFVDDDPGKWGQEINGYGVHEPDKFIRGLKAPVYAVLGVNDGYARRNNVRRFAGAGCEFPRLIHPSVVMHRSTRLGEGAVIQAGTVIDPNVSIGRHVVVNMNAILGHDAVIGDYATLAPGVRICGCVTVGAGSNIGVGASIIQGVGVGTESVIGANAAVVRDIPDLSVAVGIPARVIKTVCARFAEPAGAER